LQTQFSGVLGQVRSSVISRTEVGIAGSKAQNQGAKNLEAQTKEWLAIDDDRTRDHHIDVDTEEKQIDADFFPGGEPMAHPHDTSRASPGNYINCRCEVLYKR
jgi:hypothetical protein